MKKKYFVKLFDGNRTVGVTQAKNKDHAASIIQDWNSGGERHFAKLETREVVQENIQNEDYFGETPINQYLTQR